MLQAILTAPTFASNGTLLTAAGYHAEAHAWLELADGFALPAVSDVPSDAEVAAARSLFLDDLLIDFPFVETSDRAHMMALLLLPFARRLVGGVTPLHMVEAPASDSGKGLLVALVGVLATGEPASGGSIPDSDEELRKKITSELAGGQPLLVLDNADENRRLDSADLAAALTLPVWKDRLLGKTRMLAVPNQVVWIATGNNVRLSTELARRCIRVRIDARVDRPWLRSGFKHSALVDWAMQHRAALVHAALTLIQNWLAKGRPPGKGRLGSFESWAEVMGGILEAAGIDGFLGNLGSLYDRADTEGAMWRELVIVWWATHRDEPGAGRAPDMPQHAAHAATCAISASWRAACSAACRHAWAPFVGGLLVTFPRPCQSPSRLLVFPWSAMLNLGVTAGGNHEQPVADLGHHLGGHQGTARPIHREPRAQEELRGGAGAALLHGGPPRAAR